MAVTAEVTFTFQELELILNSIKFAPPVQQGNILCQDLVRKLSHAKDVCKMGQKSQALNENLARIKTTQTKTKPQTVPQVKDNKRK